MSEALGVTGTMLCPQSLTPASPHRLWQLPVHPPRLLPVLLPPTLLRPGPERHPKGHRPCLCQLPPLLLHLPGRLGHQLHLLPLGPHLRGRHLHLPVPGRGLPQPRGAALVPGAGHRGGLRQPGAGRDAVPHLPRGPERRQSGSLLPPGQEDRVTAARPAGTARDRAGVVLGFRNKSVVDFPAALSAPRQG